MKGKGLTLNREILRLGVPSTIATLSVPLIWIVDTALDRLHFGERKSRRSEFGARGTLKSQKRPARWTSVKVGE